MKPPLRSAACGPLLLSLGLLAGPALADDDCDAPVRQWQPREAVMQMAAQKGWQVQRLKIDDGCYELRGRDAQGRGFKAKIDPRTLAIVKMKQRDHDHDGGHERRYERERQHERHGERRGTPSPSQIAPMPPDGPTPLAPLPPGGSRATIE